MPYFVSLMKFTEKGHRALKNIDNRVKISPGRVVNVGGRSVGFYPTLGDYDLIQIFEIPSVTSMMKYIMMGRRDGYVEPLALPTVEKKRMVNNNRKYSGDQNMSYAFPQIVPGVPHGYPLKAELRPENTALLVIDMQHDFLSPGGYMYALGVELTGLRAAIEPIRRVLHAARLWGCRIVHTREGYAEDLSDLQPWKHGGAPNDAVAIGDLGCRGRFLIRGEPSSDIIPELAPTGDELVFDKPSYGAFVSTDLGQTLTGWGVQHVVLTGVTTDCCVTTTLREALDRGYDCLVLADCVGSTHQVYHEAALSLMRRPSGIFGATALSTDFIAAIERA
jgi:biuret amidohydrolase